MLTVARVPTPSWARAAPTANRLPPRTKATAATRLIVMSWLDSTVPADGWVISPPVPSTILTRAHVIGSQGREDGLPVGGHADDGPSEPRAHLRDRLGLGEGLRGAHVGELALGVVVVDQQGQRRSRPGRRPL